MELVVYMVLQPICKSYVFNNILTNIDCICYYIYGNTKTSHYIKQQYEAAICSLLQKNVLVGSYSKNGSLLIDYEESFLFDAGSETYTYVYWENIYTILNSNSKNKAQLCEYYVTLMSMRNYKTKIARTTISYLMEKLNMSRKTIIRYNKFLVENKIIYIKNAKVQNNGGTIQQSPNLYCEYTDRQKLLTNLC